MDGNLSHLRNSCSLVNVNNTLTFQVLLVVCIYVEKSYIGCAIEMKDYNRKKMLSYKSNLVSMFNLTSRGLL